MHTDLSVESTVNSLPYIIEADSKSTTLPLQHTDTATLTKYRWIFCGYHGEDGPTALAEQAQGPGVAGGTERQTK